MPICPQPLRHSSVTQLWCFLPSVELTLSLEDDRLQCNLAHYAKNVKRQNSYQKQLHKFIIKETDKCWKCGRRIPHWQPGRRHQRNLWRRLVMLTHLQLFFYLLVELIFPIPSLIFWPTENILHNPRMEKKQAIRNSSPRSSCGKYQQRGENE